MIEEFKVLEFKGFHLDGKTPYHYWVLQLADNLFFAGYDEIKLKTAKTEGFASHIAKEEYAYEYIGFIQNFYNTDGSKRLENSGMVIPPLVGLSEASEILGWDERKVSTYIKRNSFPKPLRQLASGPIWTYKQIEDFKNSLNKIF